MPLLSETFLRADRVESAIATLYIKGVEFDVRPAANKAYVDSVRKPPKDRKDDDDYYSECVAKHLLVEIRELLNDDKTEFKNTLENKTKLLVDYVGVGTKILFFASEPSNFSASNLLDEELGNSEASPSGN